MRNFSRCLLSLVLMLSFVNLVAASDLTPRAREKQKQQAYVPYSWSGFYVGINGGGAIGASGAGTTPFSALVPNDPADRMKGWMLGGQIGARQQVGMGVFGVEADIDWTNIENRASACSTARRTFFATQLADTTSCQTNGTKVNYLSTVVANAGLVIWEKALLSVNGGLAFGQVRTDNSQSVVTNTLTPTGTAFCAVGAISCPNGSGAASDSKTMYGWTIGAALEVALSQNWSTKLQYGFADLGSINSAAMGGQKVDLHFTKFGLNYRF